MLFSSPIFLFLFLPMTIAGYFILPKKFRNLFLLLASLIFYTTGEGQFLMLLLFIIVLNFFFGLLISNQSKRAKLYCILAITSNLLILIYFKYFIFLLSIALKPLTKLDLNLDFHPQIHLPLGISFITFHIISYLIDIYTKKIKPEKSFFNFALYVSLFPHLIAGPIVRFSDIGEQIKKRRESIELFASGVNRFIIGLGKKVILADTFAKTSDKIFGLFPHQISPEILWLGLVCYAMQIYFDFSGYSDMAIGLARMFGFNFKENFNYPYISKSIQEFWRRWHISLSSWFRDYLYIPLGGSRQGLFRTCLIILVVFTLTGFWHGANWHFIFWGLYFGFFLVLERLFLGNLLEKTWLPLRHIYALLVISIGWLFFRIENLQYSLYLVKTLFGLVPNHPPIFTLNFFLNKELVLALIIGTFASTPLFSYLNKRLSNIAFPKKATILKPLSYSFFSLLFLSIVLIYSIIESVSQTYNPFIYFRF